MKDENKIKLLENKKQSVHFNLNNTVTILVSFVIGLAAIFIQVQLAFNNPIISWGVAIVYIMMLKLFGFVDAALTIPRQLKTLDAIDKAIYNIITKQDTTGIFIEKLYPKENMVSQNSEVSIIERLGISLSLVSIGVSFFLIGLDKMGLIVGIVPYAYYAIGLFLIVFGIVALKAKRL